MTDKFKVIPFNDLQKDRLIDLIRNSNCVSTWDYHLDDFKDPNPVFKLADYLLANGVIVPPCKVWDTVFVVSQGQAFCMCWNVYEGKVVDIHLNRHNKLTIRVENGEKFFGYYEPCFIFLTKEEAEQKLKELGK